MTEKLIVLGATGSVGMQSLDAARSLGIRVVGLSASSDIAALENMIREFKPLFCAVENERAAADLAIRVADTNVKIIAGKGASEELASLDCADTVLNSISGMAGLRPTLAAVESGKKLALANKESLVTLGEYVMKRASETGCRIVPVDSEHCAIFQCLRSGKHSEIKKLILTASGGPFYGMTKDDLRLITKERALAHPTWKMGPRITIDSATMMNKGFEVIEAVRLFGVTPDKVDVVIHRESIIHSMTEYIDNAVIAQMSVPDMRFCAGYALAYPDRAEACIDELDLPSISKLTFFAPDKENFPLLDFAYRAMEYGGTVPAAMNAADEEAVGLFLDGKISFTDISELVIEASTRAKCVDTLSLAGAEAADAEARQTVRELAR